MHTSNFPPEENLAGMANRSQELLDLPEDSEIWTSLKQSISASSGFQRWQAERHTQEQLSTSGLETLIRRYLRETLETLAY
jgi:hypothetical protein